MLNKVASMLSLEINASDDLIHQLIGEELFSRNWEQDLRHMTHVPAANIVTINRANVAEPEHGLPHSRIFHTIAELGVV